MSLSNKSLNELYVMNSINNKQLDDLEIYFSGSEYCFLKNVAPSTVGEKYSDSEMLMEVSRGVITFPNTIFNGTLNHGVIGSKLSILDKAVQHFYHDKSTQDFTAFSELEDYERRDIKDLLIPCFHLQKNLWDILIEHGKSQYKTYETPRSNFGFEDEIRLMVNDFFCENHVLGVYNYGSTATGNPNPNDLDLLILLENNSFTEEIFVKNFGRKKSLEVNGLPVGINFLEEKVMRTLPFYNNYPLSGYHWIYGMRNLPEQSEKDLKNVLKTKSGIDLKSLRKSLIWLYSNKDMDDDWFNGQRENGSGLFDYLLKLPKQIVSNISRVYGKNFNLDFEKREFNSLIEFKEQLLEANTKIQELFNDNLFS